MLIKVLSVEKHHGMENFTPKYDTFPVSSSSACLMERIMLREKKYGI